MQYFLKIIISFAVYLLLAANTFAFDSGSFSQLNASPVLNNGTGVIRCGGTGPGGTPEAGSGPYAAYSVHENPEGQSTLVRGVDFVETIYIRSSCPNGTTFWNSWPVPGSVVRSYPFLSYDGIPSPFTQIQNITTFTVTDNFTWSVAQSVAPTFFGYAYSSILYDVWLVNCNTCSTIAANIIYEIEYFPATSLACCYNTVQTIRNFSQSYLTFSSPAVDVYLIAGAWNRLFVYPVATQTNKFDNPTMTGSVNGTPGTMPTHTRFNTNASGLLTSVIGSGSTTVNSVTVNYVDFQITGTSVAGTNVGLEFDDPSGTYFTWNPTTDNNGWVSAYLAVTAGSTANLTNIQLSVNEYDSGFGYISTTGGLSFISTLTSSLQHFGLQFLPTASNVGLAQPQLLFFFNNAAVVNITVRVGLPVVSKDVTQQLSSETFDWVAFFSSTKTAGLTTGAEYLNAFQFGPETTGGQSSVTVNNWNVNFAYNPRSFTVSPAVSGLTTWDLDINGPMTVNNGTWTITPNAGFSGSVTLWGAGGGTGGVGSASATNGAAGSAASTFSGLTANVGSGVNGATTNTAVANCSSAATASGGNTNTSGGTGGAATIATTSIGGNGGAAPNGGGATTGCSAGNGASCAGVAGNAPGGGASGPAHGSSTSGSRRGIGGACSGAYTTKVYAVNALTVGTPITLTVGAGGTAGTGDEANGAVGANGRATIQ